MTDQGDHRAPSHTEPKPAGSEAVGAAATQAPVLLRDTARCQEASLGSELGNFTKSQLRTDFNETLYASLLAPDAHLLKWHLETAVSPTLVTACQ